MKKPRIFSINDLSPKLPNKEALDELSELNELLIDEKFNEIIARAENAMKEFPENYFFYILAAISHSKLDEDDRAIELLLDAIDKFPDQNEIYFQLGKVYHEIAEFENAIKAFKNSYEITPEEYHDSRAECLNEIGICYWEMERKDEALEQWKLALMEDPKNIDAYNNLRELTNEYDAPMAVSPEMDDIFHFQKLQLDKYLKSAGKKEMDNEEEILKVIGLILETWNKVIAPNKKKLDSSTPAEKTKWFNSTEIDFSKEPEIQLPLDFDDDINDEDDDDNMLTLYSALDEEEILMAPFTFPFFLALEIPKPRVDALYSEEVEPTEYEFEMLDWALAIVDNLFSVVAAGIEADLKKELIEEAILIAREELDEDEAEQVVHNSISFIRKVVEDGQKQKKKKPQRKKKKKRKK